ncbi:MAG: CoA activase [Spirochaetes bacterium]|nr:CoA activase [Spirochaetota bacterium]
MKRVLGIDVGSIAVSAVLLDGDGSLVDCAYSFHEGNPEVALSAMLGEFALGEIGCIAATGTAGEMLKDPRRYDSRVSFITAARHHHRDMRSLLIVGGEKFGMALFSERGEYLNYRSNTSCAAGTGSFLEQQAKRLNLRGIEEFSEISFGNTGSVPRIASRCSVFAKTDLIHAQQEGYSLEEICDGLCYGLAKNVADTLFAGTKIHGPLVFAGGVSRNRAVAKHLSSMVGADIVTGTHGHLYGAAGAALLALEDGFDARDGIRSVRDIVVPKRREKIYYYDPLVLEGGSYPDFSGIERYEFSSSRYHGTTPVEVDIYVHLEGGSELPVYLGIDIGSTSTKAVLVDGDARVLAGFYTRTAGRPVTALQTIFECIDGLAVERGVAPRVLGVGTTGSGRKFIGEIIGADLVLDEITAHARAAWELDPRVDTIIEIGGQDSKFTTLRGGMVTFSIMNNVCAAGTGSFIEEQAKKLGCPLSQYSLRAEGARAPLSSDRCTVFMERDLNYYLSEGYSVDEILASVLHSVRDNYLTKVAIEKNIGERVFFQGATAKNRALVAAFEQRLGRPIAVSKFCHITGAMGVALSLRDEAPDATRFRGIELFRAEIPIRTEICDLCTNHCKIRLADLQGETAAFGFLCGRDYDTRRYVRQEGLFDLLKERQGAFETVPVKDTGGAVIGIPAALHLFEDLPLWRRFFSNLGLRTVTSEGLRDAVKEGKRLTGAEFCAPLTALHGHAAHLAERCDHLFLPVYVEEPKEVKDQTRNYCYYTQYAPAVVTQAIGRGFRKKVLSPVVRSTMGSFYLKLQLFRMLRGVSGGPFSFSRVSRAYDSALALRRRGIERLREMFLRERAGATDVQVVFVGRPYTILSREMNGGITDIFSRLGITTFFQDMVPVQGECLSGIDPLLRNLHWRFAARIMETAQTVAAAPGLYPVYVTSFKCTPDSYAVEYFKQSMDRHRKPYLILQLDEHDSSVGYETRIEAGIRAFRNHFRSTGEHGARAGALGLSSIGKKGLAGKTLLIPRFDPITCRLLEGVLKKYGLDARLVEETTDAIQRSMRMNSGQCIPLTIMVQNAVDYIVRNNLDPASTVIWTLKSQLSCNVGMFPAYTQTLLEGYGRGMEKVAVYAGDTIFQDLSLSTAVNAFLAFIFGGALRRIGCRIRPYETNHGETDGVIEWSIETLYRAFTGGMSKEKALHEVVSRFQRIPAERTRRPKVAIFGDLYVRENDVLNQDLIRIIEAHGGEVVTTPYSDLVRIVSDVYIKKWFKVGKYSDAILSRVLTWVIPAITGKYERILAGLVPQYRGNGKRPEDILSMYHLNVFLTGESMENILKIMHLRESHDDLALLVQTNPSYCCPSLVTEAMAERIEEITGIPIVTIEYDGTGGPKNEDVIPYLRYLRREFRG